MACNAWSRILCRICTFIRKLKRCLPQTRVFTIRGVTDCSQRGYDTSGYFEIDTGTDENWTVQLTEEGAQ